MGMICSVFEPDVASILSSKELIDLDTELDILSVSFSKMFFIIQTVYLAVKCHKTRKPSHSINKPC